VLCAILASCMLMRCYWSETTPRQWSCVSVHGEFTCWHSARGVSCNRQAGPRAFVTKKEGK
jgi:hypothetical protein